MFVYAKPGDAVTLAGTCAVRLDYTAASIGVISPFQLYGDGDPPDALRAIRHGAPREIVLVRNAKSGGKWEAAAINALTDGQPDRVIQRSVTPVGSPEGKIELVSLVIA